MKMLVHRTPLSGAAPPFDLDALKVHLRAEGDAENEAITTIGQTAAAEIAYFFSGLELVG